MSTKLLRYPCPLPNLPSAAPSSAEDRRRKLDMMELIIRQSSRRFAHARDVSMGDGPILLAFKGGFACFTDARTDTCMTEMARSKSPMTCFMGRACFCLGGRVCLTFLMA